MSYRLFLWRSLLALCGGMFIIALLLVLIAWDRSSLESPDGSYLLFDRQGSFLAELGHDEDDGYGYWPIDRLPDRVVSATLAIEDRRFWYHPGIDPIAAVRAGWQNVNSDTRVSGASTIAMQVARMQRPANRNLLSKVLEASTALMMTARHGRHEILSHYLRRVPYGNNSHGIAYASRRYLDKPVEDLSWAEIAFLSAIPQSPSRMNPFNYDGRKRAIERGKRILARLHVQQVTSDEEHELAIKQISALYIPHRQRRSVYAMHAILKIEKLLQQGMLGEFEGYMLQTSLDLSLQNQLVTMTDSILEQRWRKKGAGNAAVIVLDKNSSEVLAWVGSGDYFDDRYAGSIDYTQVKRSSGSTLKPFTFALALEQGHITPATVLADIPVSGVPVRNSDAHFLGPLLPRQALANSRNVPAYNLVRTIGMNDNYALLQQLGLHQSEMPASHYGLGIALGALPVSLENLVQAYSVLANDGNLKKISWLKQNTELKGKRIFSEETTRLVTLFLSDANARLPSFPRMGTTEYSFPVALKTGTSQGYRDAWTVAYSSRYIVGVWTGDPDNQPMKRLGGAGSAADLTQRIVMSLHDDQRHGMHDLSFPPPDGYTQVSLCSSSGKLASDACDRSYQEWLTPEQIPQQYDQSSQRILVDSRTGLPADRDTPEAFRQIQRARNLPPQYALWAEKEGMQNISQSTVMDSSGIESEVKNISLDIVSPKDGARFIRNPEMPQQASSIELNVSLNQTIPQVVWYVNNEPYQISDYPYSARMKLEVGGYVIQARVPFTDEASESVRVYVE